MDGTGRETTDKVRMSPTGDFPDFRDAVHAKNPKKRSHCDASDLIVYANKAAFEEDDIGDYGVKESKLYVVAPVSRQNLGAIYGGVVLICDFIIVDMCIDLFSFC